jgi:hypothetical protein
VLCGTRRHEHGQGAATTELQIASAQDMHIKTTKIHHDHSLCWRRGARLGCAVWELAKFSVAE